MLSSYRITMETESTSGNGLTELYIDESRSVILVYPKLDIELSLKDPKVGQAWNDVKGQLRDFAEFVLANGNDNSAGACIEQLAQEAYITSESFHIEGCIGPEGKEEAADLYIDGDSTVTLVLPDREIGQPGSDVVAFFSDCIGPQLAKKWENLKGQIRGFAGSLTAIKDQSATAVA
ncbi:MAG: hypothetical protein P8Z73_16465 [Desulfobacteraceae bacterium]|jgi:hypothetical protein